MLPALSICISLFGTDEACSQMALLREYVDQKDQRSIREQGYMPTFGEIQFLGMDDLVRKLSMSQCSKVYDLGSGRGKLVFYLFLQYHDIKEVHGYELSQLRFKFCSETVFKFWKWVRDNPDHWPYKYELTLNSERILLQEIGSSRCLSIHLEDMFHAPKDGQVYIANVAGDSAKWADFVSQCEANTKFVFYESSSSLFRDKE